MILTLLQLPSTQHANVRKARVVAHEPVETSPGQEEKAVGLQHTNFVLLDALNPKSELLTDKANFFQISFKH